jgi:hypothetical protein
MSDTMPSCMRAPPDALSTTIGSRSSTARRYARTTFSPWAAPIEPPSTSNRPSTNA